MIDCWQKGEPTIEHELELYLMEARKECEMQYFTDLQNNKACCVTKPFRAESQLDMEKV